MRQLSHLRCWRRRETLFSRVEKVLSTCRTLILRKEPLRENSSSSGAAGGADGICCHLLPWPLFFLSSLEKNEPSKSNTCLNGKKITFGDPKPSMISA